MYKQGRHSPLRSNMYTINSLELLATTLMHWSPSLRGDRETVYHKQKKHYTEFSRKPLLPLYTGISEYLVTLEVRNQRAHPFMLALSGRSLSGPTPGGNTNKSRPNFGKETPYWRELPIHSKEIDTELLNL